MKNLISKLINTSLLAVLIISFPRSGTSLTLRIFKNHPNIERIYFETKLLRKFPVKKSLINLHKSFGPRKNCAEKIIYEGIKFGSKSKDTPIVYCDRWNRFFKKEAKIIQVMRHPKDVWNSLLIKLYLKRHWEHIIIPKLNDYFDCIGKYFTEIDQYENSLTIKYEDLILDNENVVNKIYNFCGLEPYNFKETMRIKKVFWYKEIGMRIDNDVRLRKYKDEFNEIFYRRLPKTLEILNKFPGTKYED